MANEIQERVAAVAEGIAKVQAHCMCARFEDDGYRFRVIYPEGDFPVQGVQAEYAKAGKSVALARLLPIMERHWLESFP